MFVIASYEQNVDAIGGGFGGFSGFGGGCGLLVLLLVLFAVFSGGGLFGRRDCDNDRDHDRDFDEIRSRLTNPCGCVSNCQIDKDVVTSRDAGIIEQNKIYEKQLECKINEQNMVIQEQKNQLFVTRMFAELQENMNARLGGIQRDLDQKPSAVPHFAATVDQCAQPQRTCFDRFSEGRFFDRDRDRDDCCFC